MAALAKRDFLVILYYNFKRGLTTKDCFEEMIAVFKKDCPSLQRIKQFRRGSFSLNHEPRPGRPVEVSTPESEAAVQKEIEEDRRMTYRQLEELLNILVINSSSHY